MPWTQAQRRGFHEQRKAAGICVHCGAGLPEDAERVMCVECSEIDDLNHAILNRTAEGRERNAANQRKHRADRLARGLCVYCPNKARENRQTCEECRVARTKIVADYRARKRAGIVSIASERRRRSDEERERLKVRLSELRGEFLPSPEVTTADRILVGLRRMDWPTSLELFHALGVEGNAHSKERSKFSQTLSRLVRRGRVQKRGPYGASQYAIAGAAC